MITGQDVVDAAREMKGTPFHHQGRSPGLGIDCIGLLVAVAKSLGIEHQDSTQYGRDPSPAELRAGLENSGLVEVATEDARVGDVLVFWIRRADKPKHVGILTGYLKAGLIHTYADVGSVVEHVLDDFWRKRICGAWRYPGVVSVVEPV